MQADSPWQVQRGHGLTQRQVGSLPCHGFTQAEPAGEHKIAITGRSIMPIAPVQAIGIHLNDQPW
jgi:hypothetical protein